MRSYTIVETDLGWVGLMRSTETLCASTLPKLSAFSALRDLDPHADDLDAGEDTFQTPVSYVRALLAGQTCDYGDPLDLSAGTSFQQAVWCAARLIPFGETRSYRWVAETAGHPLAAHAAGQAVAGNPLPLFVPCHRVIAASGELGGYGHGAEALPTKRSLLRLEGVHFPDPMLEQVRPVVIRRARVS
jgi:methylated-DNA-[protein]-cysteine S-methyltransferase